MAFPSAARFLAGRRAPSVWGGALLASIVLSLGALPATGEGATGHGPARTRPESARGANRLALRGEEPAHAAPPAVMTPPAQTAPLSLSPVPAGAADDAAPEAVVLEGGISVAVGPDQRTTVLGETQSLRAVIEEICRQAHIDLRTFAAPDRRYVGKLENVPLPEALRSILRSESYLLGFRDDTSGGPARITWMRVLGGQPNSAGAAVQSAAAQFAAPQPAGLKVAPPPSSRFAMSTALLFQAFGTYDPVRRDQAQREMIDRINQPDELQRFLATDAKQLATMFGRYRDSEQTIRRLKSMSESPEIQAKFEEVLTLIGSPAQGASEQQE